MDAHNAQIRLEQRALQISMLGSVIFVVLEFIIAFATRSQAVLMDCAYDAAELVLIAISLKIVPLLYKPLTEKRPFGYGQVESLFVVFKGSILVAVTAGLIANNVIILFQGGHSVSFNIIGAFELFAALLGGVVMLILRKINKKLESPLLTVEIDGWYIDTIASIGLAVAFFLPAIIKTDWMTAIAPYLDSSVAIFLSLFILPVPVKTVISGMRDLFLIAPEQETVDEIKRISEEILARDHFLDRYESVSYDIIRTGRRYWVSIYLAPKENTLSISQWSAIQQDIEDALTEEFNDVYVELLPDIE
ncbi:MAG: cation diffusion facilitator family transporter [Anaerovoracaceae bacterium]|jgi:predicted Co/Zn/Cd cation transporter (cation efflux family)